MLERDHLCPSQQPSVATISLGGAGASYPLLHVYAGIFFFFSGLSLLGTWHPVSSYEYLPSCLENAVSLWSSTTSGSYNPSALSSAMIPEPWKAEAWYRCLFRDKHFGVYYSLHIGQLSSDGRKSVFINGATLGRLTSLQWIKPHLRAFGNTNLTH